TEGSGHAEARRRLSGAGKTAVRSRTGTCGQRWRCAGRLVAAGCHREGSRGRREIGSSLCGSVRVADHGPLGQSRVVCALQKNMSVPRVVNVTNPMQPHVTRVSDGLVGWFESKNIKASLAPETAPKAD